MKGVNSLFYLSPVSKVPATTKTRDGDSFLKVIRWIIWRVCDGGQEAMGLEL